MSLHGDHCISGGADASIRIYDLRTGEMIKGMTDHAKSVKSIVHHPTLDAFFTGSMDQLHMWQLSTFESFYVVDAYNKGHLNAMAIDDTQLVTAMGDGTLQFMDLDTMQLTHTIQSLPQPDALDGSCIYDCLFYNGTLLTADMDKTIKVYSTL